jgi:PAS domain S-box-containing protein
MEADHAALVVALEHAPSGVAVLGDHGRITWVNRRMAHLLRRDAEALVGTSLGELMHPDDVVDGELDLAAMHIGRVYDRGRKRLARPDGTYVWTGLTLSPAPPPGDPAEEPPTTMVASVFDLTELVYAEEQLGSVVAGLSDPVMMIDGNGRVAAANPAAQRLLGDLGPELVGLDLTRAPWELLDEEGSPLAPEASAELTALAEGTRTFATMGVRHGDETRWVEVAAHPLERSGERWVAATYKDVSERLRIEAALKAAEAADRAKSEFLSRMSHELRTPLNAVLGFAQLLQIDELTPSQQEAVDQILRAGHHLLGLLNEVLDLERMQSGRLDVHVHSVSAMPVLQEAVELAQPLAVASGIAIDVRASREGPVHVLADDQRLRQVLLNLITNGVKFNRPHGRVTVTVHVVHDAFVIRVADTGPGIAPDDLDRIFMPFERLDADRRGIDGAGVGLALAKQLTDAMGGAIGVESVPGEGSTFFLVLRVSDPGVEVVEPPPPVDPEVLAELLRRTDPTPRRILYIEDNEQSRTLMERITAMHGGLELTTARTAGEGLAQALATSPDAILLDLHLPDGSGDEVMASLQEDPSTRDTPVIVLTADATPTRRARLTESGAVAYLTKPVDLSELFAALEVALATRA